MYYGSWKIDDYLTFAVNCHRADTGAATDGDGVPTYRVYEDETDPPIVNGNMAILDDDDTTGFYTERIQLTAGNGFEKGKSYNIYIEVTVNSVKGTITHFFQMEAEVDANIVSGTVASVTNVGTVTGNVNGSVGSVTGGATAAELAKVPKSDAAVSWNATALGAIQSECNDALVAYDPPTKGEMDTAHALLATPAQVATALTNYDAPTKAEMDSGHALLATPAEVETACDASLVTYDPPTKAELDSAVSPLATTVELAKVPKSDSNVVWNATAQTTIQTKAAAALSAYDPPTKTEMDTGHGLLATPAEVQTAVDARLDAANTELASVPSTSGSLRQMIQFAFTYFRNKKTVTSATESLKKEDASTELGSAALSDDGTTFTKGEMG